MSAHAHRLEDTMDTEDTEATRDIREDADLLRRLGRATVADRLVELLAHTGTGSVDDITLAGLRAISRAARDRAVAEIAAPSPDLATLRERTPHLPWRERLAGYTADVDGLRLTLDLAVGGWIACAEQTGAEPIRSGVRVTLRRERCDSLTDALASVAVAHRDRHAIIRRKLYAAYVASVESCDRAQTTDGTPDDGASLVQA